MARMGEGILNHLEEHSSGPLSALLRIVFR